MSQSARMEQRFSKRRNIRRVAAVAYILSSFVYLAWRLTIFNEHAMVLSTMYFVADVFAVTLGILAVFVSWNYRHRTPLPAPPDLKVDVLIPVYKEPIAMVRRTILGAQDIRYPHETWLLDDGRRPELKALAEELGCRYLVRADNRHAKAGNLNHALKQIGGDFVAVFDADHIPQPHALDVTLGFFADPKVAMVQTPQDYFNIDALQYANNERTGGLWHDQSFFYNISQPGRDFYDAGSCAGTSVVYRRSALDEIGGFPTETVTEDVHTSLKLHKRGYRAPFLNEPIAYGVAASDLADYYRTRQRYGHGNIHALRIENVLFCKGLTFRQRLSYLFLGLIYLEGWQQLLVFLVPSVALIFGIAPFDISVFNVLVVLVFPLWTYALMQEIGCGFSRYWTNEIFAMIRWPVHIVSSVALFRSKLAWRSSRKDVKGRVEWLLLAPQLAVVALSLTALGVGVWRLAGEFSTGPLIAVILERVPDAEAVAARWDWLVEQTQSFVAALLHSGPDAVPSVGEAGGAVSVAAPPPPPLFSAPANPIDWFQPLTTGYTLDLVLVAGFWALINALRGIFVVAKVVRNARASRADYAFRCLAPVEIETGSQTLRSVAERLSGTEIRLPHPVLRRLESLGVAYPLGATIYLPGIAVPVMLQAPARAGAAFLPIESTDEDRAAIDACLYAVGWHRDALHHHAEFVTPLAALGRMLGFWRSSRPAVDWHEAALAEQPGAVGPASIHGNRFPVILQGRRRKAAERIVAFQPLRPGSVIAVSRRAEDMAPRLVRVGPPLDFPTPVIGVDEGQSLRAFRYAITGVFRGAQRHPAPEPGIAGNRAPASVLQTTGSSRLPHRDPAPLAVRRAVGGAEPRMRIAADAARTPST